jgi:hypothetical protein
LFCIHGTKLNVKSQFPSDNSLGNFYINETFKKPKNRQNNTNDWFMKQNFASYNCARDIQNNVIRFADKGQNTVRHIKIYGKTLKNGYIS